MCSGCEESESRRLILRRSGRKVLKELLDRVIEEVASNILLRLSAYDFFSVFGKKKWVRESHGPPYC